MRLFGSSGYPSSRNRPSRCAATPRNLRKASRFANRLPSTWAIDETDVGLQLLYCSERRPCGSGLVHGNLYAADIESAKRHAPTVFAPGVVMRPGLGVILQDARGREIWRGPYLGRDGAI